MALENTMQEYVFNKFKGTWQIWFHPNNKPANKFWTDVVDGYTKGSFEVKENKVPYYDGVIGNTLVFNS